MNLLTVDTSTTTCSVALTLNGRLAVEYLLNFDRTLSRQLLSSIDTVLRGAGVAVEDLDGFGVALGPGSFTGVRVGVATVKGLALATGKPVAGFSSLAMLAMNLPWSGFPVCPMFDARKKEVYAGVYRCTDLPQPVVPDTVLSPEAFVGMIDAPTVFLGDGALRYRGVIESLLGDRAIFAPPHCHQPRAAAGALLAAEVFRTGSTMPLTDLNPAYIRPSEADLARMVRKSP